MKAVTSSPDMRDKKELIEQFIARMTPSAGTIADGADVTEDWETFIREERERELNAIIAEENLDADKTRSLMVESEANGFIETNGMSLTNILPPMPLFGAGNKREEKKRIVVEKLDNWLRRFTGC